VGGARRCTWLVMFCRLLSAEEKPDLDRQVIVTRVRVGSYRG
jgi:hypothetical protein